MGQILDAIMVISQNQNPNNIKKNDVIDYNSHQIKHSHVINIAQLHKTISKTSK